MKRNTKRLNRTKERLYCISNKAGEVDAISETL